jgi:hypothetical protein
MFFTMQAIKPKSFAELEAYSQVAMTLNKNNIYSFRCPMSPKSYYIARVERPKGQLHFARLKPRKTRSQY